VLNAYPQIQELLWQAGIARLKARGNATRNPLASQYLQMAMDTGLIHGESVLLIDLNTCTRCDDCVRACADTHGGTPRFIREGAKYQHWTIPVSCYSAPIRVCRLPYRGDHASGRIAEDDHRDTASAVRTACAVSVGQHRQRSRVRRSGATSIRPSARARRSQVRRACRCACTARDPDLLKDLSVTETLST
jgi:hypothetical protein